MEPAPHIYLRQRLMAGEFIWPEDIDVYEANLMARLLDECIDEWRPTVRPGSGPPGWWRILN